MNSIPIAERSTFSQKYSIDDITVNVEIFRCPGEPGWRLEVTSDDDQINDWSDMFATEQAAWDEFLYVVETEGITAFL